MNSFFEPTDGSILAPHGYRASGVFCDIKRLGTGKGSDKGQKRDLALVVSESPAAVAGLFTTNQVCAAPVKVCIPRAARGIAQAIVANSGNANACTGPRGLKDALDMAADAAAHLDIPADHVLVASTGRIGVSLPMDRVHDGIRLAAADLGNAPEKAAQAAEAILTSDTRPKQVAVRFTLNGKTACIGGICKGAGMIQPGMSPTGKRPPSRPAQLHATMLAFLTTDAAVAPAALRHALTQAVALSFNRITVDGDMSTNDTVLFLANGHAANTPLTLADFKNAARTQSPRSAPAKTRDAATFQAALNHVCLELARLIVRDGEGVSRLVTVRIEGAGTPDDAEAAARAVANSSLVKTSWCGGDPNWGRIVDALGYSAARIVEDKIDLGYSAPGSRRILWSLRRGRPTATPFAELCAAVAPKEFDLHIRLNLGAAATVIYAADLTEAYVDFNKGDVSNPAALGG
jgi:glutamate N-acetyltransferase/amino-acid N-acetyltransferase